MKRLFLVAAFFLSCAGNRGSAQDAAADVPSIPYRVVGVYPHDTMAFTEGLLVHEGLLYESTGASDRVPGTRTLFGPVDLRTGIITPRAELHPRLYFGEGIAFLNGKVYQLTYQDRIGFIYDAVSFKMTGRFRIPSKEGWGLTTDGRSLIMSDGTDSLTWIDPAGFAVLKKMAVTENGRRVPGLNELEVINGAVYANVFASNGIVKIDTATGAVLARLDLTPLVEEAKRKHRAALELNGIACDPGSGHVFITGKLWPVLYRIEFAQ